MKQKFFNEQTAGNRKIRILGIVPYEGMKSIMQKQADNRNDIDLDVFVGDLEEGVEIAQKNFHNDYDIIISRGGTAELIGNVTQLPVIEISLSVYDVLRSIKMAESFASRYAIVGFPSITKNAQLFCDLLQYKVDIRTISSAGEAENSLLELKKIGYRMIICDTVTNKTAKKLGLNAILISSGAESISNSFDQAVKLCRSHSLLRAENRLFRQILEKNIHETVIFDETNELYYSTLESFKDSSLLDILKKESQAARVQGACHSFKNSDGTLYSINSQPIIFEDRPFTACYFSSNKIPISTSKNGIQYLSKNNVEASFYNSFYMIPNEINNLQSFIEQVSQTNQPLMIIGEPGTGKEHIARTIYAQSIQQRNPLININFSLVNDKAWNFLINHYNSPFNDNNNTIYFENINALTEERLQQLLVLIIDMNLVQRNRLIMSCVCNSSGFLPDTIQNYINQLSCLVLNLPPLRKRQEEIPTLANLSLSACNANLAKEILGFEDGAMELLLSYSWPNNYTQFERIMKELTTITVDSYISEAAVASILKREQAFVQELGHANDNGFSQTLNLNRTLDEINRDIIHYVLNDTQGNQSAAAKRLGISRTTLWRLLK